jgi:hypothetical protein
MSDNGNQVLTKWKEIKDTIEVLEIDVAKNANGVMSAGPRLRKGLRQLQLSLKELIKLSMDADKVKIANKLLAKE